MRRDGRGEGSEKPAGDRARDESEGQRRFRKRVFVFDRCSERKGARARDDGQIPEDNFFEKTAKKTVTENYNTNGFELFAEEAVENQFGIFFLN